MRLQHLHGADSLSTDCSTARGERRAREQLCNCFAGQLTHLIGLTPLRLLSLREDARVLRKHTALASARAHRSAAACRVARGHGAVSAGAVHRAHAPAPAADAAASLTRRRTHAGGHASSNDALAAAQGGSAPRAARLGIRSLNNIINQRVADTPTWLRACKLISAQARAPHAGSPVAKSASMQPAAERGSSLSL